MNNIIEEIEKLTEEHFGRSWEIGFSTLNYPHNPYRATKEIFDGGLNFPRVELGLGRRVKFGDYIDEFRDMIQSKDVKLSVHVPFLYDDLAHPHPEMRDVFLNEARKSIELADLLGADWVVVHPGYLFLDQSMPDVPALEPLKEPRERYLERSRDSISELAKYSQPKNITLCVENIPYGLGQGKEEIEKLITDVSGTEFLLDIGHAHIAGRLQELLSLQPSVYHFHDNMGEEDQHLRLGQGNIDLAGVLRKMSANAGKKMVILELYTLEDVEKSLEVFRKTIESL